MLNINFGEKIKENCSLNSCPIYKYVVALSNNSDLKGIVKCPDIFCERIKESVIQCSKCKTLTSIFQGFFNDNGEFKCYQCNENNKEKIEIVKNTQQTDEKMKEICKTLIILSKNKKFLDNYVEKKDYGYEFYNPFNTVPTPLTWSNGYINENSLEALKKEVLNFFSSYLEKFQEKDCNECEYGETHYQHMCCTDCSRNKNSMSLIKMDRFKKGGE